MKQVIGFAVSLVWYPLMSMAAALHGVGAALWFLSKHLVWFLGMPIAAATVARASYCKAEEEDKEQFIPLMVLSCFYLVVFAGVNAVSAFEGRAWWWNNQQIFLALIATNAFSILYEIGRAWWKSVTDRGGKRAVDNSEAVGNRDYTGLYKDIVDERNRAFGDQEAQKWYLRIAGAEARSEINFREANSLRRLVENRCA